MKLFRLLCLLISVVLIVVGVNGCMKDNNILNIENSTSGMIKYMSEKYNDTFSYAGSFGGSDTGKTKNIYITSKKYPNREISVCYHNYDGTAYITENYTQNRFKIETEEYIMSMMKDIFGVDVILTYNISSQGTVNDFNEKTTFEEYIASKESDIVFKAVVSDLFEKENMADVAEKVKSKIEKAPIIASAEIYFASSSENFKTFSKLGYFEKKELNRIYFSKDSKNSIEEFEWR